MVKNTTKLRQISEKINALIEEALLLVPEDDSLNQIVGKPTKTIRDRAKEGWYRDIKDALLTDNIGFSVDMLETIDEMRELDNERAKNPDFPKIFKLDDRK